MDAYDYFKSLPDLADPARAAAQWNDGWERLTSFQMHRLRMRVEDVQRLWA